MRIVAFALLLGLAMPAAQGTAAGQTRQGTTVNGVAVDPTGAVLPGAQVQLKPAGGNSERSTTTDATGLFRFEQVAPGRYDVLVSFIVNGVEVNNLNVASSGIQQIKINQDPYSAEYPRPGRGRIEVVLKPGSQEYHGTANAIFRDSALDAKNAFAAVKAPEQRRIFEGFLSGPVRHSEKTSFTLSVKDNADDTQAVVFAQGPAGAIEQNVPQPYRNVLAAATVNHQRSESTSMSLTLSYQDQTMHNQGVGRAEIAGP